MKFNRIYFLLAVAIFIAEVFIALYVHDNFIRPFFGDFLVVILIYCAIKAFSRIKPGKAAVLVLLFSYTVETLQYFNFIEFLGLKNNTLAKVVLGNSFSWLDILCYTLGIFFVLITEKFLALKKTKVII